MQKEKKSVYGFIAKAVLLTALTLVLFFFAAAFFPDLVFPASADYKGTDHTGGKTVNLVLLGFDRSAARDTGTSLFRPDTIIIAAIDTRSASISMVSIPRDSYVQIHGRDRYDKINHSYMYGYYSVPKKKIGTARESRQRC
jgi:anionic cell wall polymer biosynthesis LytR-Cps2A-Psr (LCP) family protein